MGGPMDVLLFTLSLAASVVILVVSMLLTSSFMGGVEFGETHTAVAKGAALLLVVNAVALIPTVGIWLTLPIWWGGLMLLFNIDFWEARTLVVINWALNLVVHFVLALLLHGRSPSQTELPDHVLLAPGHGRP